MILSPNTFPQAILHVDADCFFASCEVAKNPALRGKPVVVGKNRGIAVAMTYEAKERGVTRGMSIARVKTVCPDAVILDADYELYAGFSTRIISIIKKYTPIVEAYSIDECFADLTGLRRPLKMSYKKMAQKIKQDLESALGITFSVGLAPTKVLAKVASKWKKPAGLTIIPANEAHTYLAQLAVGDVWHIGPQTASFLKKLGVHTALAFAAKEVQWVKNYFTKSQFGIWQELRGIVVYEVQAGEPSVPASISKTKTFTPVSTEKVFVFAQLSKNIEQACAKARRHGLVTKHIGIFLKTQEFRYYAYTIELSRASALPYDIIPLVKKAFDGIILPGTVYRATGVVLKQLHANSNKQLDLFQPNIRIQQIETMYESVDNLAKKYGNHAVFLGSSFNAITKQTQDPVHENSTKRKNTFLKRLENGKRFSVPVLGTAT
ncbi:MAG: DNA polymerase IV [Candidatus Magasanikbacteria bacterium]|nr:DNA polymerase IV [Candidatus Magasanikbacteria bacterium]